MNARDLIKWFPAQLPGSCIACGASFADGEDIGYVDDELVGFSCCAGIGNFMTGSSLIMPRGMVPSDRCDICYIVHSPGQEECE